ncbi:MAG: Ger(x)C family spore germination protein [Clostridiaceae bacterium]|nr:Ger(x)C family spore germination protein [Clostridiaceae bacterium]
MIKKSYTKLIAALTVCTLLLSTLTSCWDYIEYEELAQIIAIGIDYDKQTDNIVMTLQFIPTASSSGNSGSEQKSGKKGLVHSASDSTLYGALAELQQIVDKNFFYGYFKVLVIGKDAAQNILEPMMDLHDRTPAIRSSSYIVFTPGKAEDILSTIDSSHSEIAGNTLANLLDTVSTTGSSFPVTMQQFLEMLSISGLEAVGPSAYTNVENVEAKGGTIDHIRVNEQKEGKLMVSGLAAFKGGRLAGWLNDEEGMGVGWVLGKKIKAYKITQPKEDGKKEEAYFRISSSKSKIKIKLVNAMPSVDINIKISCALRKYYTENNSEFIDSKVIKELEEELSKSIKSDIEAALKKAQKDLQSDIFGFGFEFYRKYTGLWKERFEKEWDEIFPNIPVNINVAVKIPNTGTNIRSISVK